MIELKVDDCRGSGWKIKKGVVGELIEFVGGMWKVGGGVG